jgi:SHS2 domain-containing protein
MQKYTFVGHTADTRLHIEASTLTELFQVALSAMAELIHSKSLNEKPTTCHEITISSPDTTSLLIDFLAEVLALSHMKITVFTKVEFQSLTPTTLTAKIYGVPVDHFEKDVKAVTYHEAEVKTTKSGTFETSIIFDI